MEMPSFIKLKRKGSFQENFGAVGGKSTSSDSLTSLSNIVNISGCKNRSAVGTRRQTFKDPLSDRFQLGRSTSIVSGQIAWVRRIETLFLSTWKTRKPAAWSDSGTLLLVELKRVALYTR